MVLTMGEQVSDSTVPISAGGAQYKVAKISQPVGYTHAPGPACHINHRETTTHLKASFSAQDVITSLYTLHRKW